VIWFILFGIEFAILFITVPLLTWNPIIKKKTSEDRKPVDSRSMDLIKSKKITMFNFTCITVDKIPSTLGKNNPAQVG
jgi:nitric oxide reductase large subunit